MKRKRTAMIFAAGLGTRLRPITDSMPKALVPYHGVPMLERVIILLRDSGFERIVINVHHFASMIEDFVYENRSFGVEILFSDERDLLRDTGGGIRHAASLLKDADGSVLLHNVDIVSNISISDFYKAGVREMDSCGAVALLLVSRRDSGRYLLFDGERRLRGWENIRTGEIKTSIPGYDTGRCLPLAFSGIHIISPDLPDMMERWREPFSIIDFYLSIADSYPVMGFVAPEGVSITDMGKMKSR